MRGGLRKTFHNVKSRIKSASSKVVFNGQIVESHELKWQHIIKKYLRVSH
jgi:hypothetical protein